MCSDVHTRVGTPHMKMCSDVQSRVGTPHIKMCSDDHTRVGTPHMKTRVGTPHKILRKSLALSVAEAMWWGVGCGGYVVGGWLRRLCGGWSQSENNATLWLHLASWDLPDSQLS